MITIFGATGNTESVIANELVRRGERVRLVARHTAKLAGLRDKGAEIFEGDVLDAESVKKALAGAEGAYFLLPPDPASTAFLARCARIIEGYVAALAAHPLEHAVLLSSVGAQLPSGTGPIVTVHRAEEAFRAIARTAFTFVRAAYFMEDILGNAQAIKGQGVLPIFGGGEGYPFPMVAAKDIGLVAADALANPPRATEIIELSGPKEYSFVDAAVEASAIVGRKVTATPLPIEALVPTFTKFGVSSDVAELYREMTVAFGSEIGFDGKGRAVRGKTTLGEVLSALRG